MDLATLDSVDTLATAADIDSVPRVDLDRDLDRLGDEIAELAAHLDAASARLLDLIREFDARGGWNTGFRSCAAWLTWRIGLAPGAAREHVRVARALGALPRLAQALARGELSYSKVRELTRVATAETEERLLAVGRAGTAEHVARIVRGWRRMDRKAELREAALQHARRGLHVYENEDGMVRVKGWLTPEAGALLRKALAAARASLYPPRLARRLTAADVPAGTCGPDDVTAGTPDEAAVSGSVAVFDPGPTMEQQEADALVLLAEAALHHGLDPGAPGERYQVVVHVDAAALADVSGQSVLDEGMRVPAGTSQRLACDASRVVMRYDTAGNLREVGARTRTIPPAIRRALQHRDQGCRFPGCGVRFGQGHHIRHWAQGGPTTLRNLALLCRRHHRAVHEEGYEIERLTDGNLQFRRPNGCVILPVPPPHRMTDDPVHAIRSRNDGDGLRLHAHTAMPSWLGEHLDVGYAIDVLHPIAAHSR